MQRLLGVNGPLPMTLRPRESPNSVQYGGIHILNATMNDRRKHTFTIDSDRILEQVTKPRRNNSPSVYDSITPPQHWRFAKDDWASKSVSSLEDVAITSGFRLPVSNGFRSFSSALQRPRPEVNLQLARSKRCTRHRSGPKSRSPMGSKPRRW